jgi:hypothetical protein
VQAWSAFGGGRHGDWERARSWRRLPSSMHAHDAVGLHSSEERVGKWKSGALACGRGCASAATVGERGDCACATAAGGGRGALGSPARRRRARVGRARLLGCGGPRALLGRGMRGWAGIGKRIMGFFLYAPLLFFIYFFFLFLFKFSFSFEF